MEMIYNKAQATYRRDQLDKALKANSPGLRRVAVHHKDGSSFVLESAKLVQESGWVFIVSEHHRAMAYHADEVTALVL